VILQASKLCGYGHAFTIKAMNANLLKKGSPYIRIHYCKYCGNKDTIGVLDEDNDLLRKLGFIILYPHESKSGFYEIMSVKQHE
jgi:hypothetical protein